MVTPAELAERMEADRSGEPYVLLHDYSRRQRIVFLGDRERLTIGRIDGNDLVIDWDAQISRTHAVIERLGPTWTIVDDGLSRNGTFVNEMRIAGRQQLVHEDKVRVGQTTLAFSAGKPASVTTVVEALPTEVPLTEAQRRVLVALCRPFAASRQFPVPASNRAIADDLHLSLESVRTHMRTLFDRFGIPDLPQNAKRAELARRALNGGVVLRRDLAS